jgi:hypothetical protein
MFHTQSTNISQMKNLAEHWDLPNTWILYSKDVASVEFFKFRAAKGKLGKISKHIC